MSAKIATTDALRIVTLNAKLTHGVTCINILFMLSWLINTPAQAMRRLSRIWVGCFKFPFLLLNLCALFFPNFRGDIALVLMLTRLEVFAIPTA